MAVFRVEKTKDFTIMSNHHLRNTELSLKAKGLLSLMLSLPEDWDYTTKGLAHICKDGVDSITTALKELERHGYLTRQRLRYDNGQLGDIEYTIHEQPVSTENTGLSPKRENPRQVKPEQAKPKQAEPEQENPAQLNTNLTRIDNALAQMPQRLEAVKNQLENLYQQQAAAKEEVGKPFPFEDDLRVKSARLVELDTLLNIDGKGHAQPETVVAKSARPSVLDSLKRPMPPRSLEKKPKQHEEVR